MHPSSPAAMGPAAGLAPSKLSVKAAFAGTSVLLTGATGYVGSLVLEQILRCCPDVKRIYCLVRGKRKVNAELRMRRLLHSGLFHLVRDRPELLRKVVLLEGDLLSDKPHLGVDPGDLPFPPPNAARAPCLTPVLIDPPGPSLPTRGSSPDDEEDPALQAMSMTGVARTFSLSATKSQSSTRRPSELDAPSQHAPPPSMTRRTLTAQQSVTQQQSVMQLTQTSSSRLQQGLDMAPMGPGGAVPMASLPGMMSQAADSTASTPAVAPPMGSPERNAYAASVAAAARVVMEAVEVPPAPALMKAQGPGIASGPSAKGERDMVWDGEGRGVRGTLADVQREARLVAIHCAARIALEDPVQVSLRHNYGGARSLLEVLRCLPNKVCLLHVSTAFVNCCKPFLPDGLVEEKLYPLKFGDQEINHSQVVADLMGARLRDAQAHGEYLAHKWGFPNTYVLGKHMTEQLICSAHSPQLPVAIVRPSLVSAVAGQPYPGFVGNLAGPSGFMVAFAMGFMVPNSRAFAPFHHIDGVPGDICSSLIITAAAALLQDTQQGLPSPIYPPPAPPHPPGLGPAARAEGRTDAAGGWGGSGAGGAMEGGDRRGLHLPSSPALLQQLPKPAIFHAATSSLQPICHLEVGQLGYDFFRKNPPRFKFARYHDFHPDDSPPGWKLNFSKAWTGFKVKCAAKLLGCLGHQGEARRLVNGFAMFDQEMDPKNDFSLVFSVKNALFLEARLVEAERAEFPVVWRGSWTDYAQTYMAGVSKLYLGMDIPAERGHGFVHIPDRRIN